MPAYHFLIHVWPLKNVKAIQLTSGEDSMKTVLNGSPIWPIMTWLRGLVLCLLISLTTTTSINAFELLVGTGMPGTFSQFTARALCRIMERQNDNLSCNPVSSEDELDILTNVQGGSLDLALVDSQLLSESLSGKGPFRFLDISYDQLRIITPLYNIPVVFIVRADAGIDSYKQLPGKRINVGAPGSQVKYLLKIFMQAQGWSEDDFSVITELSSTMYQDKIAFNQGTIQAMAHRSVHPDPAVGQLLNQGQAKLIGLNGDGVREMIDLYPGVSLQTITESGYKSITGPLETFGTTMVLVTSADMDNETARLVTETLHKNKAFFKSAHPSLAAFTVNSKPELYGGLKVHEAVLEWVADK